ncbi:MAG TPA: GTPase [archaeon]|nr:GTPase [archaeon]
MQGFWRTVDNAIDQSNILLEVVDARIPDMTRNKSVENRIQRKMKMFILVLNKADLITEQMKEDYLKKTRSRTVVFVSSKKGKGIMELKKMIVNIARKKRQYGKIKIGVVGYPNTGKSSIINRLTGRASARTSPIPGMTRGVQWIAAEGNIVFLDTPGVMPFGEKDETERALMSVIDPEEMVNPEKAAMKIIELFLRDNKKALEKFYDVKVETDNIEEIFLQICRRKNFLLKGGNLDEARTALAIIRDWQKGNLLLNFMPK